MANFFEKIALATVASVATIAVTLVGADSAKAQTSVVCESVDFRREVCRINTRGDVYLYREYSRSSCRGNWGYGRGYVWVRNGCRAQFVSGDRRRDRDYYRNRRPYDDRYNRDRYNRDRYYRGY